jgi:Phasin protein
LKEFTMARTTTAAAAHAADDASTPRAQPSATAGGAPDAMAAARTFMNLSLSASRDMLQFMEQAQHTQTDTVADMVKALGTAIGDARSARDVQALMEIQTRLANEQLAHAMKHGSELFNRMLGARMQLFEHLPGAEPAARRAAPTGNGAGSGIDPSPLAMMTSAQAAWTRMMQQWVDTVHNGPIPS